MTTYVQCPETTMMCATTLISRATGPSALIGLLSAVVTLFSEELCDGRDAVLVV
jgi:hypothetical protein